MAYCYADMNNLNHMRSLVAVAETGSLTAAARRLQVSQPTMSRMIRDLEDDVGEPLFIRHGRGMQLNELGNELYEVALDVHRAAERFESIAAARGEFVAGIVRISASEVVAAELLPEWVVTYQKEYPEVQVAIVADDTTSNIASREADLAVRMFEPRSPDLVRAFVGDAPLAFFATSSYLDETGRDLPFSERHIVGLDRDQAQLQPLWDKLGEDLTHQFVFRTDHPATYVHAVKAGLGVGILQPLIARKYPELEQVHPEIKLPGFPMYLVTHRDLRKSRLVRTAFDSLKSHLTQLVATI